MPKKSITTKRLLILKGDRTLRRFADSLGIGQSTLHNYLKGRDPKAEFLRIICTKTGCDANWLLGLKGKELTNNYTKHQLRELRFNMLKVHIEDSIKDGKKLLNDMGI
jgi:transcriptional regulator with XRE-family HTH domain